MGKKHIDAKRLFVPIVIVIGALALLAIALLALKFWEEQQGDFPSQETEEITMEQNGTVYVPKESIETFLVLGLDKYEGGSASDSYNNDKQADFIMLFVFDNAAKRCSAIHINRDTMAMMNILGVAGNKVATVRKQIALSHTYGNGRDVSCRNTADAVSELLLGVKVNHYVSLTMDSVATMNDLVGGVEVTVLDDFTGIDDALVKGETVTLTGEQALHYVRTRYGLEDSSNSTRMARQQQYIRALHEKIVAKTEADEEFIVDASLKMADYMISDRSVTQLQELARKFEEYEFAPVYDIEGESQMGEEFIEFYPNADSVKQIVIDLFYQRKK